MMLALLLAAALVALAASCIISGAETGAYVLNRVKLRVREAGGEPAARRLAQLMKRPEDLVIAFLLGNTLADFVATTAVTTLLTREGNEASADLLTTLILTPIVLIIGGIIPKDWFRRDADRLMYALALPIHAAVRVGTWTGLIPLLRGLARLIIRLIAPGAAGGDEGLLPRMGVRRLIHEGAARGGLSVSQRDIIDRVMNVAQVRVADVMIPRARAAVIPADISREDFLRLARMAHFSRMPVHAKGEPRRIMGIINVFDVLADATPRPIAEYFQPAIQVRDAEPVPTALVRLQNARHVMGIAVDGQGLCVGLFTMKDLLEELVGELEVW